MAQFNPTVQVIDPPNAPDYLANAVLSGLSRPLIGHRFRPWGVVKTFIFAGLTFGLAPLFFWPRRFRDFVDVERQQLWHLAEWLRLQTADPDAAGLRDSTAGSLALSDFLRWAPVALGIVMIVILVQVPMAFNGGISRGTYQYHGGHLWADLFVAWNVILSLGYFIHWLQVCRHANALATFTQRFNEIVGRQNYLPVGVPSIGVGVGFFWLIAALIGVANGALWAMVAMLAGVVQWRYVWSVSRRTRSEMAERVEQMLSNVRPPLRVVRPVAMVPREVGDATAICGNQKCLARISPIAAFCPRCGARTGR